MKKKCQLCRTYKAKKGDSYICDACWIKSWAGYTKLGVT